MSAYTRRNAYFVFFSYLCSIFALLVLFEGQENFRFAHSPILFWLPVIAISFLFALAVQLATRLNGIPWDQLKKALMPHQSSHSNLLEGVNPINPSDLVQLVSQTLESYRVKNIMLQDQWEQQLAIIQSMKDGIITLDKKGRITSINEPALHFLHIKNPDLIGKDLSERIRSSELLAHQEALVEQGDHFEIEIPFHSGTPQEKMFQVRGHLFNKPTKENHAIMVLTDVTRLRKLEDMRKGFVANVSHELKTPLTSVKGYAETLMDMEEFQSNDMAQKFLGRIHQNADRLQQIIEDLLTLSRIEQNGLGYEEMEKISFQAIFDHLKKDFANHQPVPILFHYEENLCVRIHGPLLHQALFNLIENAFKYSGSPEVEVHAGINSEQQIEFEVIDHGKGIPSEHLPHLLERFYRVDKARSREKGGTGLGLSIVKHIAEAHGGSISIKSTYGSGSVFSIVLPPHLILTKGTSSPNKEI